MYCSRTSKSRYVWMIRELMMKGWCGSDIDVLDFVHLTGLESHYSGKNMKCLANFVSAIPRIAFSRKCTNLPSKHSRLIPPFHLLCVSFPGIQASLWPVSSRPFPARRTKVSFSSTPINMNRSTPTIFAAMPPWAWRPAGRACYWCFRQAVQGLSRKMPFSFFLPTYDVLIANTLRHKYAEGRL